MCEDSIADIGSHFPFCYFSGKRHSCINILCRACWYHWRGVKNLFCFMLERLLRIWLCFSISLSCFFQ